MTFPQKEFSSDTVKNFWFLWRSYHFIISHSLSHKPPISYSLISLFLILSSLSHSIISLFYSYNLSYFIIFLSQFLISLSFCCLISLSLSHSFMSVWLSLPFLFFYHTLSIYLYLISLSSCLISLTLPCISLTHTTYLSPCLFLIVSLLSLSLSFLFSHISLSISNLSHIHLPSYAHTN